MERVLVGNKKSSRGGQINYGLNLLRIIAMLFIVGEHFVYHGLPIHRPLDFNENLALSFLYLAFAKVEVNCFVLISGYFLIYSQGIKWKHIGRLWGKTLLYSVGLTLLFLPIMDLSVKDIVRSALPVKLELYWFITAYIGMYLLHPMVNRAVCGLSQRNFLHTVFLFVGMFCLYSFKGDTFYAHWGRGILWMMTLYLIGGYIRLYGLTISRSQGLCWFFADIFGFCYLFFSKRDVLFRNDFCEQSAAYFDRVRSIFPAF